MQKKIPNCPVEVTLMMISDRWKVLIIRDLLNGTMRFGELKKSIGNISQKVLTSNLRSMEECGLVNRKVYAQVPPKVEYSLTEIGYSLKSVMDSMSDWGEYYKTEHEVLEK
ncbi:MAG: helix-turn-helix domain-containing protein [Peptostreptococcus sp.]|uniref:winged helix-turn-helix transcriptional regulator n=1 Tax=Peptostreptococcus sp. TaxID=1262 RepID=UPI002FCB71CC